MSATDNVRLRNERTYDELRSIDCNQPEADIVVKKVGWAAVSALWAPRQNSRRQLPADHRHGSAPSLSNADDISNPARLHPSLRYAVTP